MNLGHPLSINNPWWSSHYQKVWHERAVDRSLPIPLWLRVSFLAMGNHKKNGHCLFQRGELARRLAEPDRKNLQRAIKKAIQHGFLSPESCSECLVVPPHAVTNGMGGKEDTLCPVHERKRAANRRRRLSSSMPPQAFSIANAG